MGFAHKPVLLDECIAGLNISKDGVFIDGTLGSGGHSREILKRLDKGRLIAIDRDTVALEAAKKALSEYSDKLVLLHANFSEIGTLLEKLGMEQADGMLFDLGVSSPQLDDANRGFSHSLDAPLDMRMNPNVGISAYDIVNTYDYNELKRIFRDYGEERYAPKVAANIVKKREGKLIKTTFDLAEIIAASMPRAALKEKQHPAKRCFQALRIEVNDELGSISEMLASAPGLLKSGGRIAVISFHSLEDRLVKRAFKKYEDGCICPPDFPVCTCGFVRTLKVITSHPITASGSELSENPRARSAKLRIAEKV